MNGEVDPLPDSDVQPQANFAAEPSDVAAAPASASSTSADVLPEVAEALGAMLQQLSVIQGAATDAERDAGYDALAGMLDEVQKKQPPPAAAPPPAEPPRPRPLTRQYSNASTYSPGLARQPPVPVSTNTRVYDEFVASMPSQAGKTAFVTGSNTGLGFFAAKALAKRGACVVLLCRSVEKAEAAKREMIAELGEGAAIETAHLDLSSLASVRECAATLRARHAKCHMLLLNAGLMAVHHDLTEDGHDVQLQVNHLGHFLLTHELLPLLVAAGATGAPARVVSHASHAHHLGWPSFCAATADGPVGGGFRALPLGLAAWVPGASCWARYGQSKLCNVLFTAELQRRLAANGAGVIATAAHPGVAFTQLVQVAAGANPLWDYLPSWHRYVPAAEAVGVAQSCADGSTPLLLAATDADAVGGEFYGPAKHVVGAPVRDVVRGYGNDEVMARELWTWSEAACGLTYEDVYARLRK